MSASKQEILSKIPSIDVLLQTAEPAWTAVGVPRLVIVEAARAAVENARAALEQAQAAFEQEAAASEEDASSPIDEDWLREKILAEIDLRINESIKPHHRKVVNATGIILHTALGRAVLPQRAVDQLHRELSGYSLVQVDLETGKRSRRDERIEKLLRHLTGAEAATVVNNNAAATMIVLNTLGHGKEIIVSRGQLVEIGGSFRLPDVMAAAGVKLVEVGTTNKTHLVDYERAITENTAALMRVHPSNYKILGFTSEVPLEDLVRLGRAKNIPVIDDVGSGALIDYSRFGFDKEPTLPESVATGADVITCSADKMIGGPQGGIILGKASWIQAIRKNPLARVVRVDKMTLTALEATLSLFLDEEKALGEVPTLKMLCRPLADIRTQAERIAASLSSDVDGVLASVVEGFSQMGSGSLPAQDLPTFLVAVEMQGIEAGEVARRLRLYSEPVFARVHDGQTLLDPRTLLEGDEKILLDAFCTLGQGEDYDA